MKLVSDLQNTPTDSQAIEVEVVEVDGITVPDRPEPVAEDRQPGTDGGWPRWQGKVMQLDSRWWPLWVLLGIIALALLMTVGVVIGVIFVILRLIKSVLNAIFR